MTRANLIVFQVENRHGWPMDLTYKIKAADGQTYGPASREVVQGWITEGRITPETSVARSDAETWQPARLHPELVFTVTQPAAPGPLTNSASVDTLHRQVKAGAGWFYWIAGLSLINSISTFSGSGFGFILGLGITQIIDAGSREATAAMAVPIMLDALVLGFFILLGWFANRNHSWAFVIGLILYTGDAMIFVLGQAWLSVAFHAYVIYRLVNGLRANLRLKKTGASRPFPMPGN